MGPAYHESVIDIDLLRARNDLSDFGYKNLLTDVIKLAVKELKNLGVSTPELEMIAKIKII